MRKLMTICGSLLFSFSVFAIDSDKDCGGCIISSSKVCEYAERSCKGKIPSKDCCEEAYKAQDLTGGWYFPSLSEDRNDFLSIPSDKR